ncbi:MAG: ATP-binding protein, partial [Acidobacteriia bacterium]|nr:ATP-binding protein [Terriglobia bacterium]
METQLPFVGMAREIERLSLAFATGDPLLLLGPQGSGKTRLIKEALFSHDHVLYIAWQPSLHALLAAMARALIAVRHAGFISRAKLSTDPEAWLAVQASIRLKGLLWAAVESSPVPMVLDGIAGAGFPTYRVLQRIYHTPGVALFAASRDTFSLGALARLFWNPAKALNIPPLHGRDAEQLFEAAADHFKLRDLDLDEFREKVLASAGGNPGQIIEMCRLATQPQYHAGR